MHSLGNIRLIAVLGNYKNKLGWTKRDVALAFTDYIIKKLDISMSYQQM